MTYTDKLRARIVATGSNLCVGIDPRPDQVDGDFESFVRDLASATAEFAAAFKPNIAYFEALGSSGIAGEPPPKSAIWIGRFKPR